MSNNKLPGRVDDVDGMGGEIERKREESADLDSITRF
jgi:hypothetical protein